MFLYNKFMDVAFYKSPIGTLKIFSSDTALHRLDLVEERNDFDCSVFNYRVMEQLDEYFAGKLHTFNLPVVFDKVTGFQKSVYDELLCVRYGKTKSYKELAQAINNPKACRAVGTALGKNPIPIIVPCHRIINTDGKIGEFALGTEAKRFLLELEKAHR